MSALAEPTEIRTGFHSDLVQLRPFTYVEFLFHAYGQAYKVFVALTRIPPAHKQGIIQS